MKKLIFAASFLAASAVTASAADLAARPYTKATPIAAAAYDWSGFYVGATAGGAWSKDAVSLNTVNGEPPLYDTSDIPSLNALGSSQLNQSHGIFGGRIGYNYQVSSLVVGLEGDLSSFRFNRSASATGIPFNPGGAPFGNAAFNQNASTSWLATVRGRIGYAADRVLFYGTAGAAFANVKFSNSYLGFSQHGTGDEAEASASSATKTGWAAGAGIEYALTNNWIVSAEYLHVDLGSLSTSGLVTTGAPENATFNFSTKLTSDIARAGISYKFR